jgi:hypothetical protein
MSASVFALASQVAHCILQSHRHMSQRLEFWLYLFYLVQNLIPRACVPPGVGVLICTSYMVHHFVLYCKCIWPSYFCFLFAHIKRNPDPNPKPNLKKGTTWYLKYQGCKKCPIRSSTTRCIMISYEVYYLVSFLGADQEGRRYWDEIV